MRAESFRPGGQAQRTRSARRHGGVAGFPFAEDEERRLTLAWDCERRGRGRFLARVQLESNAGEPPRTLRFDVDSPFEVEPPALADAALLLSLFPALLHGGHLHVEGDVSRRLARNLIDLQALWIAARPERYRPFRLGATRFVDAEPAAGAGANDAIMPLSGGVDSMLTLCRHTDPERPLGGAGVDLRACLFLPGFSPPPHRRDAYPVAIGAVRRIAELRGLPLAVAETNYPEVVPFQEDNHGAFLAGALHLFASRFRIGLIASSVHHLYPVLPYYGSSPQLDPFCSSGAMEIRNDGGDLQRDEKCAALGRYPDVLDSLIVCFGFEGHDRNCCRCEKCTRTMLNFLAAGEAVPEKAFPKGIELARIGDKLGVVIPQGTAGVSLRSARALGVRHPALARLRRRYRVKRAKRALRSALTWLLPGVDLLQRDYLVPRWLSERRARAAGRARRRAASREEPPA
jgi:hypothetical protein